MKKTNNVTPRFAHLEYRILHELELSIAEYFLLDMIFHLSGSGTRWCNKKLENIAFDMRLSKLGVIKMRDRLIEKGLVKKGVGNRLSTSEKVNKVYFLDDGDLQKVNKVTEKVNKVYPKSKQSITKTSVENNKRIIENNRSSDLGKGYELYLAGRQALKQKLSVK